VRPLKIELGLRVPVNIGTDTALALGMAQVIIYYGWENYQFEGFRHFKKVIPSSLNPIELLGYYGHLRSDVVSFNPSPSDRGRRVEMRKASLENQD